MTLEEVVDRVKLLGYKVHREGAGYRSRCPVHGGTDRENALFKERAGGGVHFSCWSKDCSLHDLAEKLGVPLAELLPPTRSVNGTTPEAVYPYREADGLLRYEIHRGARKKFTVHPPGAAKEHPLLYRLPDLVKVNGRTPVFITEGEGDTDRLWSVGLAATSAAFGASAPWQPSYTAWLKGHLPAQRFTVIADQDEPGRKRAEVVKAALAAAGLAVGVLNLPGPEWADLKGYDVSDWLRDGGTAAGLLERLNPRREWATAPDLLAKTLPPLKWIIPGVIPAGLTIMAGRPKAGKSWGVYGIGLAVAAGGMAFGKIRVNQGAVLYLALEDSERRLQERMRSLLKGEPAPPSFCWAISWPKLSAPGQMPTQETPDCLLLIKRWLDQTPDPRLVVIDTLARIKPKGTKGGNAYEEDTEAMAPLQALTMEAGIGLIALTHTRKPPTAKVNSDFLDEVQGSTGITGIADTILGLKKTGEQEMSLFTRGRDVEERELLIRWDELTSDWELLGDAEQLRLSPLQKQCVRVLRAAEGMMHYRAVAHELGREGKSAEDSVGILLRRLADRDVIKHSEGGFYYVMPD